MNIQNLDLKKEVRKIMNFFNVGKYDVVIKKSKILLKKNPEFIALYNIIGISHQKEKNYKEAINTFKKGLLIDTLSLELNLNLANTYKLERDFKQAEQTYEKILKINPSYVLALLNYGNLKNDLNLVEDSLSLYNKALAVDENNFSIHFNKAFILQAIGKFDESIFHAKKSLELNKNFTPADTLLSKMLNYKENKWHLDKMIEKAKNDKLSLSQIYNLNFAIGSAYERIKEEKLSMKHIIIANETKRKILKYNIKDDINLFDKIKNSFQNLDFKAKQLTNKSSDKDLIFILGMPRSGTTLVEQIVSTHSKVYGAGELFTLAHLIKDEFFDINNNKKLNNNSIRDTNFEEWPLKYNDYLENLKSNKKFLTDKNPLNFLWIGFIKIIFPNAKIIHCIRNPEENCLSIFKNLFPGDDLAWCYDQRELGNYYNLYTDLMKFWHNLFPNSIYDIKYEELINNQEDQIKMLINACGLEWEEQCLNFHQNKKPIKTLSITQARQKIYKTSLNLSKNFKVELKELFSIISR